MAKEHRTLLMEVIKSQKFVEDGYIQKVDMGALLRELVAAYCCLVILYLMNRLGNLEDSIIFDSWVNFHLRRLVEQDAELKLYISVNDGYFTKGLTPYLDFYIREKLSSEEQEELDRRFRRLSYSGMPREGILYFGVKLHLRILKTLGNPRSVIVDFALFAATMHFVTGIRDRSVDWKPAHDDLSRVRLPDKYTETI